MKWAAAALFVFLLAATEAAGGLTPDNVTEVIRQARPAAVDVASGVEATPGVKDPEKVRRFIANARTA